MGLTGGPSDLTVLDVWFCDWATFVLPLSLEDLLRPELPVFLILYKYVQYSIYKQSATESKEKQKSLNAMKVL